MEKVYNEWNPMSDESVKRFINSFEDEVIYVFKTGFQDTWKVVHECAHEINTHKVFVGITDEVEEEYNIKLR